MRKLREIIIFALCILLALAPAVRANSGPTSWYGTTASGMIVTGEDCPIEVRHETLTFDIGQFPANYYEDESAFSDYAARVTAEYTFHNPTDAQVSATLLFPFGVVPQYAPDQRLLPELYCVTVDGAQVETKLRHSLAWGAAFDMEEDAAKLQAVYREHPFYHPELTVTKYVFRPGGVTLLPQDVLEAELRLDTNPDRTKYLVYSASSFQTESGYALAGCSVWEGKSVEVFVIGEVPEGGLTWTLYGEDGPHDGTMECLETAQMPLQELILSLRPEDSAVSEVDWYNAAIDLLTRTEVAYGYLDAEALELLAGSLMGWYEYDLTIPAGGTVVNTVTAPVYPDINAGWDPPVYSYTYLLSPARGWAAFGALDISIHTPYHMTQCNLEGFEEGENGYTLHLDGLPQKELTFVLSTDPNPGRPGTHAARTGLLFLPLAALFAAGAFRRKK